MKKIRNKINGVLLLDKPIGLSSNQAIQRVKRILNAEKVGHTGTLDPLATGLLPVCLGEATKFASYLLDGDKEYIATVQLGVVTDSGDSEGNVIATNEVTSNLEQIQEALTKFIGEISQTPPMYSALKHNGRPLYEYAREGIEIERKIRQVTIYELELINTNLAVSQFTFRAQVSKGTYIRTLAEDIGNYLGCGASLIALRRTKTNQFIINDAISMDSIEILNQTNQLPLFPQEILCADLASYKISESDFIAVKNGNPVKINKIPDGYLCDQEVKLFADNLFLGVACFVNKYDQFWLAPKRLMSGLLELNRLN